MPKLSATRIYRFRRVVALAALLGWCGATAKADDFMRFASPEAAYEQGMGAFKAGEPELAIEALEYAARNDVFLAKYYLARVLSKGKGAHLNQARAYEMYQEIVDHFPDVDPYLDYRAPFVARAFHELALYSSAGLDEIGLRPNENRARRLLEYAASYFDDANAQFELAKLNLTGQHSEADQASGKHWLSTLAKKGHAGAQAYLADLFWRGQFLPQRPITALALITMARDNAAPGDRIWIDEIHHQIFCGTPPTARQEAGSVVMKWRRRFRSDLSGRSTYGDQLLDGSAVRACSDGEVLEGDNFRKQPSNEDVWREIDQVAKRRNGSGIGEWSDATQGAADSNRRGQQQARTRPGSKVFGSSMGLGFEQKSKSDR